MKRKGVRTRPCFGVNPLCLHASLFGFGPILVQNTSLGGSILYRFGTNALSWMLNNDWMQKLAIQTDSFGDLRQTVSQWQTQVTRKYVRLHVNKLSEPLDIIRLKIHGAGIYIYIHIYADMTGVYWWDPWHTIYSSTVRIRHGYIHGK